MSAAKLPHAPPWGLCGGLILALGLVMAWLLAAPYAGSWNDGSRLATVEALVDQHTWAIDDSVFVRVPPADSPYPLPYARDDPCGPKGTQDKLWIAGRFYSDKSPVPALLLAGEYALWHAALGGQARTGADRFCRLLTAGSSGLAYALSLWCLYLLGRPLGLALSTRLLLTASLGLATLALPYARSVNNHMLLLGTTMGLLLQIGWLAREPGTGSVPRLLAAGCLAGLGYTTDLGAGPVLLAATLAWLAWHGRRVRSVAWFLAGVLPWLLLHHGLNYAIGGTWKPANAVPEYFSWPGCPFGSANMTGGWNHPGPGSFLLYALDLLFGLRGFLWHNLPLLLLLPCLILLWRCRRERSEVLLMLACGAGVWLMYAVASTNHSGQCCSIRWYVPLLAPGYYLLALLLRDYPEYRMDFILLSAGGSVLGAVMAWHGPWIKHMVPALWPIVGVTLLAWGGYARRRQLRQSCPLQESTNADPLRVCSKSLVGRVSNPSSGHGRVGNPSYKAFGTDS